MFAISPQNEPWKHWRVYQAVCILAMANLFSTSWIPCGSHVRANFDLRPRETNELNHIAWYRLFYSWYLAVLISSSKFWGSLRLGLRVHCLSHSLLGLWLGLYIIGQIIWRKMAAIISRNRYTVSAHQLFLVGLVVMHSSKSITFFLQRKNPILVLLHCVGLFTSSSKRRPCNSKFVRSSNCLSIWYA